jgi:hypothetical protein
MTMTGALWISRLAKLNEFVNVSGRKDEKMMSSRTRPRIRRQRADVAAADAGDVLPYGLDQGGGWCRGAPPPLLRPPMCSRLRSSLARRFVDAGISAGDGGVGHLDRVALL